MRLIDADKLPMDIEWEDIENAPTVETMPISFIKEITQRDICLVYRGCLLMLLEKWRLEHDTYRQV